MTFGISAGTAIGLAGLGLSAGSMAMGLAGSGKKGGFSMPKPPDWYEDPYYKKTQDKLLGYGTDLLEGKPNDYYKPIGEVGGSMFEDVISKTTRDITGAVGEDAARRGMGRSGATSNAIARAVGDKTTELRWSDFLRAMQGRAGFMGMGNDMVSGVRSAGLTYQGQKNQFNLASSGLAANAAIAENNQANMDSQAKGDFFGSLTEGGMSLAAMGAYLNQKPGTSIKTNFDQPPMGSAAGGFKSLIQPRDPYANYKL